MKFSFKSKIAIGLCILIMIKFAMLQGLIIIGLNEPSILNTYIGLGCLILFMPSFFFILYEYAQNKKEEKQTFNDKYEAINRSNIVVILDAKGFIIEVNENFCLLTGYKTHEIVGKHHKEVVSESERNSKEYIEFWSNLRKGEYIEGKFERIRKDGESVWLSATYTPIKSNGGAVYQIIKIAQDNTDAYKNRVEILKQNTYLEHAAKILRHDMHSGINTYIPRGLKSLKRRLSPEKIKELKIEVPIRLIEDGLSHTQKVYFGVKEFTNLVKKDVVLEKESKDLREILINYLSLTSYTDQVAIDWLPTIPVNEPLFCTAIDNFIRNGLKYNDSETKIVAISMIDNENLAIIDNGRGMSKEQFKENSKPYTRGENQSESGTGLGLNISIAILEEHGFSIDCEKQEQGTMIKVKIR